tara:strand:+ start:4537 stop:4794 length:258 start_codon:yes stop_codon:yes gene_type:complete
MDNEIEIVPFYCRLSRGCYEMLKRQAKKERWTMAGLTESILREALRKREPRSISNDIMFETPRDEVKDLKIAEQVDAMVKANDKV